MDSELKKSIAKEIKSLLMNDQGIQASVSNIRSQNNDPYRVFTEIVTQNDKAHEMIGTFSSLILINYCSSDEIKCATAKSALRIISGFCLEAVVIMICSFKFFHHTLTMN
jgi:hypothetical protein